MKLMAVGCNKHGYLLAFSEGFDSGTRACSQVRLSGTNTRVGEAAGQS